METDKKTSANPGTARIVRKRMGLQAEFLSAVVSCAPRDLTPDSMKYWVQTQNRERLRDLLFRSFKEVEIMSTLACTQTLASYFFPEEYFSPADWEKEFNVSFPVGTSFNFPVSEERLDEILKSPCPFYKGKLVRETHFLFYAPTTVITRHGHKLNLNLRRLEKNNPIVVVDPEYSSNMPGLKETSSFKQEPEGNWILMLKKILPDSFNKDYQQLESWLFKEHKDYYIPRAISVVLQNLFVHKKNVRGVLPAHIWGRTASPLPFGNDLAHICIGQLCIGQLNSVFMPKAGDFSDTHVSASVGLFVARKLE